MSELLDDGTTVLFVSHSSEQVKEMCNKAVWIEKGRIKKIGNAEEVVDSYTMGS
ncbi:Teichoic acids export ATP-binding protein TagH [compost metagenome]